MRGVSSSGAVVSLASLLSLASCGGSRPPTAPGGTDTPRIVTFVSGRTDDPVAGATVLLGGRSYRTDDRGQVVVDEDGTTDLDVRADAYLLRQTRRVPGESRFVLWPLGPGYGAEYVRSLLYKPSYTTGDVLSRADDRPSHRVTASRVSVVPSADILTDPACLRSLDQAVVEINAATEGRVVFSVDPRPFADVVFRISVDPSISSAALTWRDERSSTITGGRISFQSFVGARDPHYVTHELGHALGLEHSTASFDMMYFLALPTSPQRFTENERVSIRLLLQRPPGNRYPDNDRDGTASESAAIGTSLAVD